jgi:carotenoid cleavage dioxygenase-like enzyme
MSVPVWYRPMVAPAAEFERAPLRVVEGEMPQGLRGSLYRNGPARLERGGERYGHWFDGDGAVLAVHFGGGGAEAVYRFVRGAEFLAEEAADRILYRGYGTRAPHNMWANVVVPAKNAANTSVRAVPGKLLALWEGGLPTAVQPLDLDTMGTDRLVMLEGDDRFSAHPKVDAANGDIYNFGMRMGPVTKLDLYRAGPSGNIKRRGQVALVEPSYVHDFTLAGPYMVFLAPPVRIRPMKMLAGMATLAESLYWAGEQPTHVVVVDRTSLEVVARGELPSFYQWHFGNGCVDASGEIVLDVVRYPDFDSNVFLGEMASGEIATRADGYLWKMRLGVASGTARVASFEPVMDRVCEFPVMEPDSTGRSWRYTYLALVRPGGAAHLDWFSSIGRFDHEMGRLEEAAMPAGHWVSEPIPTPSGHVLTVVYRAEDECSEVWIFGAGALEAGPVCRLRLPSVIPPGFHGTWSEAV